MIMAVLPGTKAVASESLSASNVALENVSLEETNIVEQDNKTTETYIINNEFGSLTTIIINRYNDGNLEATVYEEGEVYTFTSSFTTNEANVLLSDEVIPINTIIDEFETDTVIKSVALLATTLVSVSNLIASLPFDIVLDNAIDLYSIIIGYKDWTDYVYYKAIVSQEYHPNPGFYRITYTVFLYYSDYYRQRNQHFDSSRTIFESSYPF